MKLDKKNLSLALTGGSTIGLGTYLAIDKTNEVSSPQILTLNKENEDLKKENEELKVDREQADATRARLTKEVEDRDVSIQGLTSEKEDLQRQVNSTNNKLRELEADIKDLENLVEAQEESAEGLSNQIGDMDGAISELIEELIDLDEHSAEQAESLRNWIIAYETKTRQDREHIQALVAMLSKQRESNPLFEKVGCWYSRTSDHDVNASYGLNCEDKTVLGMNNKTFKTLTVAWAKKDKHPQLWTYFKARYEVYDGKRITEIRE